MESTTTVDFMDENTTHRYEVVSNELVHLAALLQLILGYSMIILNSISTFIMVRSTKMMHSVRIPAINMAISGILIGTGLLTPTTVELNQRICLSKTYYLQALYLVSSLIITLMNTDRVLSLLFPFQYSNLMSRKRVRFGCLLCWLIGFLTPMEENSCQWNDLDTRHTLKWNFGMFFAIILINILEYCYVIRFAIREKRGKMNKKCIKKVSLYTGCFVLFTIPYMTSQLMHVFSTEVSKLLLDLKKVFACFMFVTPFLNAILYCLLFTECRLQMIILLCCWNKEFLNRYKTKVKKQLCTYSISISKSVPYRY